MGSGKSGGWLSLNGGWGYFSSLVVGFSTAFNGFPANADTVYLAANKNRRYSFPSLEVVLVRGAEPLPGDVPLNRSRLYLASPARALLENLVEVRSQQGKTVEVARIEEHLATLLLARGADALNHLREQAAFLAPKLNLHKAYEKLNHIVGTLLGTRTSTLKSRLARSVVTATPYDQARLDQFERMANLCREHRDTWLEVIQDPTKNTAAQEVFAFFESYFSNFIEGTRFTLEEAHHIVTTQAPSKLRPKDSHDILGVYRLASDPIVRAVPLPKTGAFAETLAARHKVMMQNRPEAEPGLFKQLRNMAGNTVFVEPALVKGTLNEAVTLCQTLPEGFSRAIFMMVVITEVHPFVDGNGRIARLCMNAELSSVAESRILVPILARDEYIDCLRLFSQQGNSEPLLQYMRRLQEWSAGFTYEDFEHTQQEMRNCAAFEISRIAHKLRWPKD